jgi:hypothetical protein
LLLKLPRLADPNQKPQVDSAGSLNGIKLARLHLKQEPVIVQRSLVLAAESHPLALAFDSNTGQVFPVEDMHRGQRDVKRKRSPSREDSDSDLEWELETLKRKINRKRAKKEAQMSDAMDEEKNEVKKEKEKDVKKEKEEEKSK